ncbi:hypothetical protein EVA_05202 [gut metagenome]|uniref:Uncharacterized protein n=1 Tax=gut metagenome TaxID=749906 RepID=J9GGX6_9ZZZZ
MSPAACQGHRDADGFLLLECVALRFLFRLSEPHGGRPYPSL